MRRSRRRGRTGLPRGVRASAPLPPARHGSARHGSAHHGSTRRLDTHLDDASPSCERTFLTCRRCWALPGSGLGLWVMETHMGGGVGGGGGAFLLVTIPLAHGTWGGFSGDRSSSARRGAPCTSGGRACGGGGQCLQGVGRCTRLNVFVVLASDYLTIIKIEITKCERVPLQRRVLLSREVPRLPVRAPVSQTVPSGE